MSSLIKVQCSNIKSRKFQHLRCPYPATKGEYCCRHWKKPRRFESKLPLPTRSTTASAKKIQTWWRIKHGLAVARERTPVFFHRKACTNETDIAMFEPLENIERDYFFVMKEPDEKFYWGFDVRSLVIQYEKEGRLENPFTKRECSRNVTEKFRERVELLRRWKKTIHYEQLSGLTNEQQWNFRVLDLFLRFDILGYRIATQWFSDLNLYQQQQLYSVLYYLWNEDLNLSTDIQERIVPDHARPSNRLFKWHPNKINNKHDLDSVRRTNINVLERMVNSASQHSDQTLGAMYSVMALTFISPHCRRAYPWLYNPNA